MRWLRGDGARADRSSLGFRGRGAGSDGPGLVRVREGGAPRERRTDKEEKSKRKKDKGSSGGSWFDGLGGIGDLGGLGDAGEGCLFIIGAVVLAGGAVLMAWLLVELVIPALFTLAYLLIIRALRLATNDDSCKATRHAR